VDLRVGAWSSGKFGYPALEMGRNRSIHVEIHVVLRKEELLDLR